MDSRHLPAPASDGKEGAPSQTDLSRGAEIIARFCSCHEVRGGRKCLESIQLDLRMILLVGGENFFAQVSVEGRRGVLFQKALPVQFGTSEWEEPKYGEGKHETSESSPSQVSTD